LIRRNITEGEELDLAIAAKYKDGKLHPAASLAFSDSRSVEQEHMRKLLVRILPDVVPEDLISSRAVSVLIKEIVACAVLSPVLQLLKDPDTWNQLIEAYGRTALQDRKTVRRMRAALDQHTSPMASTRPDAELPRLAANDTERSFERFVRAIRKTKNLSDARRFRSQIASQLKRESMVEGQDPIYLRRLEMGKRVLNQKITKLASSTTSVPESGAPAEPRNPATGTKSRELSLVEIMHTAAGLSYFMEFMDRQSRMPLVQFWIVVDGFRNPLEDDFGDDTLASSSAVTWTDADRTDIAQISEAYLSKAELHVPKEVRDAIRDFLVTGRMATQEQYRSARTAILSAQSAILEKLVREYFPSFKKSDLYYKFLATDDARTNGSRPPAPSDPPSPASPSVTNPLAQPAVMSRNDSHAHAKPKDLRRVALSSADVRVVVQGKLFDDSDFAGGSTENEIATPLFDDGYDTDPLAHSSYSIGHESLNGDAADQRQVIENMEAAMSNIMAETPNGDSIEDPQDALFGSPISSHQSMRASDSPRTSLDLPSIDMLAGDKSKPSLATLGLVNTASRIGVFSDDDLFPDEERFVEDEYVDRDDFVPKDTSEDEIHQAAPGDLGLTEAITALTNDIERLVAQESVVDTLTRKAELTNNVAELRILGKSRASLQREIKRKELQRQQYIVQESDNSLYGRSSIRIKSVMVGREDDGREFALYVIEVQREAGDQMPAATWAIARRYSEFHDLHQRLRRRYPSTRGLEFPRRRMVMKLQKQFLHNRRIALENFLQQLVRMPDVCRSRELRSFLSQQAILSSQDPSSSDTQDIVSRIYSSVTDGMDEFLGNIAVLDQLSAAGQNLISAATTQLNMTQNDVVSIENGSVAEAEAELRAFEDRELEPFVKPICDIFLEVFELNRGNNWLRGRAVVVVLHQLLGGAVERKIRDIAKGLVQEDAILQYIDQIKEIMWPGGIMRQASPRSAPDRLKTRKEATVVLATLLPDVAASVVGRSNSQAAARRITATMNNARLNQHLAFTILDEIVGILFGSPKRIGVG
jgi:sorting nexin-25